MVPARGLALLLVFVAVLVGTGLRLAPSLRPGNTRFLADGATIARLAIESARTGRMPAVDSLAEAPAGRRLGPVLPPGLIVSAGAFDRALLALGSRDEGLHLALFGALAGGLIALPVFLWARAAFGAGWAAPIAAFLAVLLPAHVHRTFGYLMRYEGLGSLLITLFLALVASALTAGRPRSRALLGAAAGLALGIAAWGWRVSLLAPPIVTAFVLLWFLWRGEAGTLRAWFSPMILVGTLALTGIEYLRAQHFLLSPTWIFSLALAAALWIPPASSPRRGVRIGLVAAAAALALLSGAVLRFENPYAAGLGLAPARLFEILGMPARGPTTAARALLESVEELKPVSLPALLTGAEFLSGLGVALVLAPFLFAALRGARADRGPAALAPAPAFLAFVTFALLVLSLLFYRSKVLLAPAVAVVLGGLAQRALAVARAKTPAAKKSPRPRRRLALATLALVALGAILATVATLRIVATRGARLDPDYAAALLWVRDHDAGGTPLVAPWGQGFEIETFARRRTVADGFLESAQGLERIESFARASFATSPDSLAAFCRRFGARQLLVPPSTSLLAVATIAGDPIVPKLRASQPLTPAEADRALVRMMVFGRDEPPFRKVFEQGLWRVYELPDPAPAPPARAAPKS